MAKKSKETLGIDLVPDKAEYKRVPAKATIREWVGLGVLAIGAILYVMDLTVLHLAVPTISTELKPTSAQLLWIIDIYGFMVAGFLVTMGTLGDRIGRRKLLMIGALAFGIFSVSTAFSKSAEMLIVNRALLGVAGATLGPSTLSLIFSMFRDPIQRGKAIGVWISSFSAGSAIGPVLGGVMLSYFWWGSVFLLAVPAMILLLVLSPRVLPEYKDPKAGKLDLLSVVLSLGAILPVIFGLKQIAQSGLDFLSLFSIAAGLLMAIVWTRRQLTLKDPMIDVKLFKIPGFRIPLLVNFLAVFVAIGYFLFVAQYLQLVLGLEPLQAGLWSVPSAIGFIISSNVAPRIVNKFKPYAIIGSGLALAALGLLVLTQVGGANGLFIVVLASVLISLGLGPVFGLTTELIVGSAPPEKAGAASGISATASELGGALGIAFLGSVGVFLYRTGIAKTIPREIPSEDVAVASDTLGAAVGVANGLPEAMGIKLLEVAREAFVNGIQAAAVIGATAAVFAAILTVILLKRVAKEHN